MTEDVYGLHLTMRIGRIERRAELNDPAVVSQFLKVLVERIGMRILAGPLTGTEEGDPATLGCSGLVILYESHAAIHTYPAVGAAFLDVFSCRDFAVARVYEVVGEFFGSYAITEQAIADRGIHWGSDVRQELMAWKDRR
jgi:S-adenosylmethionine decarboxylase